MQLPEFTALWDTLLPGVPALPHEFKHAVPDRWLRIYSLPEAKRYADSDEEWTFLLERQNQLLTEAIGEGMQVWLITGDYFFNGKPSEDLWPHIPALEPFVFEALEPFDLAAWDSDSFIEGWTYVAKVMRTTWHSGEMNDILREIADDRTRVIFLPTSGKVLIAPYDGGIDLIFPDRKARDEAAAHCKAEGLIP